MQCVQTIRLSSINKQNITHVSKTNVNNKLYIYTFINNKYVIHYKYNSNHKLFMFII